MSQELLHSIPIKNSINFRDLEGILAEDGRKVRAGLLYRSGDFFDIDDEELTFIGNTLKIKNILDYRDAAEAKIRPDKRWYSSHYFNVSANPLNTDVTATLSQKLLDVKILKDRSPINFMIELYRLLPFNNPAYRALVKLLLDNNGQSIVQHCAIGKDRTGVGIALTLFALGVSEQAIMQDYLLSDKLLASYREKLFAKHHANLTDQEVEQKKQIFLAKPIYLQTAIDTIKERYQTVNHWLEQEYQLTPEKRKIIQNYYLL